MPSHIERSGLDWADWVDCRTRNRGRHRLELERPVDDDHFKGGSWLVSGASGYEQLEEEFGTDLLWSRLRSFLQPPHGGTHVPSELKASEGPRTFSFWKEVVIS